MRIVVVESVQNVLMERIVMWTLIVHQIIVWMTLA